MIIILVNHDHAPARARGLVMVKQRLGLIIRVVITRVNHDHAPARARGLVTAKQRQQEIIRVVITRVSQDHAPRGFITAKRRREVIARVNHLARTGPLAEKGAPSVSVTVTVTVTKTTIMKRVPSGILVYRGRVTLRMTLGVVQSCETFNGGYLVESKMKQGLELRKRA